MGKLKSINIFFFIMIFVLPVLCQQTNSDIFKPNKSNSDIDKINEISSRVSQLENEIKILKRNKSVSDNQLKNSLEIAEKILVKQSFLLENFGTIYTTITLLIAFGTLFIYFASIRPIISQANKILDHARMMEERSENAIDRLNSRLDFFDKLVEEKLDNKFLLFEKKIKKEKVEEIFKDLMTQSPTRKKIAIEWLSTSDLKQIETKYVYQILDIIDLPTMKEEEKSILVDVLIQWDCNEVKSFFKFWTNVEKTNFKLKLALFEYYINNDFKYFLHPASSLLLSTASPHKEFQDICMHWSLLKTDFIIILINYPPFIDSLSDYSKKYIYDFLVKANIDMNIEEKVRDSLLFIAIRNMQPDLPKDSNIKPEPLDS